MALGVCCEAGKKSDSLPIEIESERASEKNPMPAAPDPGTAAGSQAGHAGSALAITALRCGGARIPLLSGSYRARVGIITKQRSTVTQKITCYPSG